VVFYPPGGARWISGEIFRLEGMLPASPTTTIQYAKLGKLPQEGGSTVDPKRADEKPKKDVTLRMPVERQRDVATMLARWSVRALSENRRAGGAATTPGRPPR
jgi:hypothetical protein